MKTITTVLFKVFVSEFFKSHAAFFLVTGGLCFGFMSGVEHKALAHHFVSSASLLPIPFSVWVLYTWNVILFNRKTLRLSQNEFIFHITLFNKPVRYLNSFLVLAGQLAPIILYGFFLVLMAASKGYYSSIIYVLITLLFLIIGSSLRFLFDQNNPGLEVTVSAIKMFINRNFRKPIYQFYLEWIGYKNGLSFIGLKLFGCVLLFAVLYLYQTDDYDIRLLSIGVLLAFSVQISLLFHIHQFENVGLQLYRNLPIPLWKRLLNFLCTYCILSLPEFGLLLRRLPPGLTPVNLIEEILFIMSIGILFYALLYAIIVDMERYVRTAFYCVMITLVGILFKVPLTLIVLVYTATGTYLFYRFYYRFETITLIKDSNSGNNLTV